MGSAVKKMSSTDGSSIGLNVWTLPDIQISMLSDSDITEVRKGVAIARNKIAELVLNIRVCFDDSQEDCQDLREKMAKGLFQRPTVVS